MRETFSTLLQTAQDLCVDATSTTSTSLSDTQTFLTNQINTTVQYLFSLVKNYKSQPLPRTFSTVVDQDYYHFPPGLLSIDSLTIAIGDIQKPLKIVSSVDQWNKLKEIPNTGDFPEYYFPRQSDFGIWPTPSIARTGTLVGNYLPTRMSVEDYKDGTVTVSQNSRTVTGTTTVFTSSMVGRYFCQTDSNGVAVGNFYRISAFTSSTEITLETFFEEGTITGSKYIIAQSPELPEELHEFIPYRAAAAYFRGMRRDATRAQSYMNYFFTGDDGNPNRGGGIKGGVLGIINEYKNKGRGISQMATMHRVYGGYIPEAWRTTLQTS